jgi:hypothetical protein
MKFRALVYKEIRECLPSTMGLAIMLFASGFVAVQIADSKIIMPGAMSDESFFHITGGWVLTFSIILGLILSVYQFQAEFSTRVWGFLLHRSVTRGTILISKLFSALLCFIPLLIIWSVFYLTVRNKPFFEAPLEISIFWKGLIFIILGYSSYLAVAAAILSQAKWYTTKLLSLAFGGWMFSILIVQWRLLGAWIIIFVTITILLIQITDIFLNREFE